MLFLIDFENVNDVDLSRIPNECRVKIFVGKSQNSIPFSIASTAQRLGDRLQWIKIEGDGKNNLDFHLTFYLGHLSAMFPEQEFLILSKDRGYDALISHLQRQEVKCRRINALSDLNSISLPSQEDDYARAANSLKKDKNARPKTRKRLITYLAASFGKKLTNEETKRIVEQLFSNRLITESKNTLSYHF